MTELHDLLSRHGDVASVILASPSAVEHADDRLDQRWRNARQRLGVAGTSDAELAALDETMSGLHHDDGAAVALVRPAGGPTLVEHLNTPVAQDLAVLDELPRYGPILESRQQLVPHLMVVADRAGADIIGFDSGAPVAEVVVEGSTENLHRSQAGGWSQRRFQQRSENRWESNAVDVAEEVANVARRLRARLIAIAGDVRAVTFLLEHLPSDVSHLAVKLDGQSPEAIAEATIRQAASVVASDTTAVLERFRDARSGELSSAGLAATLAALTERRVDTLLVHDDIEDDRRARFRIDGTWCGMDGDSATAPAPGAEVADGRAVDVAIRAALMGDADIRFVPAHGGPADRIGALLRW